MPSFSWRDDAPTPRLGRARTLGPVVSLLLSVTFACGLVIAVAHVLNRRFIAPVYDVVANLIAFGCAVAASLLLTHWVPALLSSIAILCWLALARRTVLARRRR
jgi:drug/metabolite transporter (DMT)-like permease